MAITASIAYRPTLVTFDKKVNSDRSVVYKLETSSADKEWEPRQPATHFY